MKSILASAAVGVALCAAVPAAAAAPYVAGTKDAKPGIFILAPTVTPFDCAGHETLVLTPSLILSLQGDTSGGPTALDGYACKAWPELGPEHVYRLEVSEELDFWAGLRDLPDGLDLDLFLLDGCDTDACLAGENVELGARLAAGTYYLVVDGFGLTDTTNAGPYTLALETRPVGLPTEICTGSVAEPLVCTKGGGISRTGTIFGQPDLLQSYACSPYLARGGEVWYALEVLPGQTIAVNLPEVAWSLDAALWLFGSCGPTAECLDAADAEPAGQPERLTWQNPQAERVTVWLGVDGARAAASDTAGAFSLAITCGTEVPVEATSFGSLRGLYR